MTTNENQETHDGDIDASDIDHISDSAVALATKEAERKRIQADIDAFLARGGHIDTIPDNVLADPPKKPESSYGSQPI